MGRKLYGKELHPVYSRWMATKGRCTDPNHPSYKNYGGRGIALSDELLKFEDYRDYVTNLPGYDPVNLTIDRIDNNKNYEKGNLRWKCRSVQTAHQRYSGKGFNKYIGVNWNICKNRWVGRVSFKGKTLFSRTFFTEKDALEARNTFIIENHLPHTVQLYTS